MATRLRDIAEEAGVSLTTVAHVLRGYTKSRIKPETCEKVLKVAAELGYRPNAIARSLKIQTTNTVGMYTGYGYHSLRDPFLAEVYTGIQLACAELNYDFIIHGSLDGKTAHDIKLKLSDGKVAGLVVHAPEDDPVVACLSEDSLPAVAIADKQPTMPSIVADDEQGMILLVDYLWERGHRHIAYLTSHIPLQSTTARSATLQRLVEARGGVSSVMVFKLYEPMGVLDEILAMANRPTAICCWNDYFAYELIKVCIDRCIRIPEDLAIVGFDGLLETRLPARRLVTVSVPWEQMAAEAVRLTVNQIQGQSVAHTTLFPVHLISGDTA